MLVFPYKIGDKLTIIVTRDEANFDRACDAARHRAVGEFGINAEGHSERVAGWERSSCSIQIKFVGYELDGCEHLYRFVATTVKNK